ncbi:MAG: virulence factor MviN [Flavobacteriaceae bacterium]|nr:virulence factor MviN [Flavobacteriaceae bacterium]
MRIPWSQISERFKELRNQPVVRNIITVGIVVLIVKLVGFYKEVVIAAEFGLSELVDTFLIAYILPGFLNEVFLNSFNTVFIPNYVMEKHQLGKLGSFISASLIITISVSIFFVIVSLALLDFYLELIFPGHTEQYYYLITVQFYYLAPCIILWGLISFMSGILMIDDEFRYSSIHPILISISTIISIVFFQDVLKERVLAVGMLVGTGLQFIFILLVVRHRKLIQIDRPEFKNSNVMIMIRQVPAKISASLINGLNPLVDQFFSAQLVVGSIAALSYGIKIPAFVISVIGMAIGNVMLPYFSKEAAKDMAQTFRKLRQIMSVIIIVSVVVMIILIIGSIDIISLLFEREAFLASDSIKVGRIQQMYLLQLPFYITGLIMVKYLTSINKNYFMVLTSIISLVLNIGLNYVLIRYMDVFGLALATSLVSMVNSIILYIYIVRINKSVKTDV